MILVANHSSPLDGIVIHAVAFRPFRVLVAAEWAGWWALRPVFRLIGAVPVAREQRNNSGAIDAAAAALERGEGVVLFPEGRLQEDGALAPFRHGAARLALRTGAPVVPCAIIGAIDALSWPHLLPSPCRITVRSGRALEFGKADGDQASAEAIHAATEALHHAVRELLARGH